MAEEIDQILASIKKAARISHTSLDDEILRQAEWAKAELVRVGVPQGVVETPTDPLIIQAIITGALSYVLPTLQERDEQRAAFQYQLDNLRKHKWEVPNVSE